MSKGLVVILSDEHRIDAVGCVGHPFIRTPNLDALAKKGTVFTDAYTPSPICVPTRAAFATGKHVHQTGYWDNSMPYLGTPDSWGHILQRGGVQVESIGKLHYRDPSDPVGFDKEHMPMMVKDGVGMVFASVRREEHRISPQGRMLGEYIGPGESDYTRYDEAVVARTMEWFNEKAQEDSDQDWCLYVGLVAPHFPLVCPEPYFSRYRGMDLPEPKLLPKDGYVRHPWVEKQNAFQDSEELFKSPEERKDAIAAYWGLCEWLDHNIGRVLASLSESGLDADVIYASDHGDNTGARGLWGKSNMYRESVGIPLIASIKGIPKGTCKTPVSLLDIAETIPRYFGLEWDGDRPGRPLQDIASEPTNLEREVISQYHAVGAVSGSYMLRKGKWKYIEYAGFEPELFDLENDPEETVNVAREYPAVCEKLAKTLREHVVPEVVEIEAFASQDRLIESFGGMEAALKIGGKGATPPPKN